MFIVRLLMITSPFNAICVFKLGCSSLINIDSSQAVEFALFTSFQNFKILNNLRVLTEFAIKKILKYCAVFICSVKVCNLSEYLPWCFSNKRDTLICRAGVLINYICVKYFRFRAFTFVVKVVGSFFACVSWFNTHVVFLKYGWYSFFESYWTTT